MLYLSNPLTAGCCYLLCSINKSSLGAPSCPFHGCHLCTLSIISIMPSMHLLLKNMQLNFWVCLGLFLGGWQRLGFFWGGGGRQQLDFLVFDIS